MAKRNRTRKTYKKQFASIPRINTRNIRQRGKIIYTRTVRIVEKRPLTSLLILLGILFLLIFAGSFLRKPALEKVIERPPKEVQIYSIGVTPKISVQAQVEKAGVIKIVALTGGVVSNIFVTEGQEVSQGKTLVALSSSYGGGNAASLQRQLANTQFQNVKDTENIQKESIQKQREVAEKTDANSDELRTITGQSIDETRSLTDLNQTIVDTLGSNLKNYVATNSAGINNQLILSTRQLISQFQSAINQLRSSLRSSEYQASSEKPQAQLSNLQKDITLKQLDLQEKALKLSLETSSLQLKIAQVQEAAFFPSAPFTGVVERIHVNVGEFVSPGTPLVTLHGDQNVKLVARVSQNLAQNVSQLELTKIMVNGTMLEASPSHITTDATDGSLYSVIYNIPSHYQNAFTNSSYVTVEIPIGYPDTTSTLPFIPIDAVYQTQKKAYLFVHEAGRAKSQEVQLGALFGQFVEVTRGLSSGDQIILDRTVIEEDRVQVKN